MSRIINFFTSFTLFFSFILPVGLWAKPFVTAHLMGQFGNQLFIMATAVSLALDHDATFSFPDLTSEQHDPIFKLSLNREKVFYHINASELPQEIEYTYRETSFAYQPIPYQPNMSIFGWFQSEKYFAHNKQAIMDLFAAPVEIKNYLDQKYSDIIQHPKTVAIHMRSYLVEKVPEQQKAYITYGRDYVERAMALFPEDSLFVVFSNDMNWCKAELEGIPRNIRFIENEPHYHDFYLMSFCKDQIISNSSFSWWAAYLNRHPNKRVIATPGWFSDSYFRDTKDLIPADWTILSD